MPLQLLHVACALQRAGYRARIYDMRLQDYRSLAMGDPVFVGLTCMSGPQIRYGLEFAREGAGRESAACPSSGAACTPRCCPSRRPPSALVDVVVRGEGELVVGPLADAPGRRRAARRRERPHLHETTARSRSTPDAALIDLDTIPVELPYDLLDLDRYPTLQAGRVHMQTSRGCPSRCGFCYNTGFNKRKLARQEPASASSTRCSTCCERFPQVKIIDPVDDNLFVNRSAWPRRSATSSSTGGLKVAWRANCRFDYLASYDGDFVRLLERAGCMELDFGGESGSAAHAGASSART